MTLIDRINRRHGRRYRVARAFGEAPRFVWATSERMARLTLLCLEA